ncbi:rRNA pseudouridine synthase [Lysinibacillus yapensis]|uniref:Pseudouridine synthase n=1 Tax=Ureibacillus yapensis TaxID=2304605 RepID=A0A396S494_9BACL|nr:pseudouridine synthase [Lysinibacillus yapensis]RHW33286.1 rRNA pseudouridine synthase [Lysinibacillus yapensis]
MRLDKLLANMGYGTRKEVKQLLKQKGVTVDGEVVKDASLHVNPDQQDISVFGERVHYTEFIYLMMNKPPGVISATEDHYDQTVINLLDPLAQHFSPFPVGRLDKDTEGLLLITNDGQLAHNLLSPKKHVPKTYFALIKGVVTESDAEAFRRGVELEDGYLTKPGELAILKSGEISEIELTIQEGKFHQVKRMFESVDKKVTYLKRISMGSLKLDEQLDLGEYRELTVEEVSQLKNP